jgi:hypothetical protein
MITGTCAACGRPGHRFGTTHGPNAPERWDPIACINGLNYENEELRETLRVILKAHARPSEPGASCAEGCGGRWPCLAWSEAAAALTDTSE